MACLSLLLPPWETCSSRIDEPERRVTGAGPAWEAGWAPVTGGPCPGVWASKDGCGRDPWSRARVVRTWHMRVGPRQGHRPGWRHRPAERAGR